MIKINIEKAQAITKDRLRSEREPLLQQLDIEFMRAAERADGVKQAAIAEEKQALRDITKQVDSITDIEQLKSLRVERQAV